MVGERLKVTGHVCQLNNVQLYEQGDGTILREFRPRDEVASDEALDSMRSIPLTIQHPPVMITAKNWSTYSKGNVTDAPEIDVGHVKAILWVHDAEAIRRIQDEELQELSLGYYASLEMKSGIAPNGERYDAIQRGHRYNHLALLEKGQARGGPTVRIIDGEQRQVVRLDGAGNARTSTPPTDEPSSGPARAGQEDTSMKFTIVVDGIEYEVEADKAFVQALDKERADTKTSLEAETARADKAEGKLDAEKERADGLKTELDETKAKLDAATDPKAIADAAQELAQAMADAKLIAGDDFEASGSVADIRRAVVAKAGVDVKGKADGYIDGRYEALLDAAEEKANANRRAEEDLADAREAARDAGSNHNDSDDDEEPAGFSLTRCQTVALDSVTAAEEG